jgi:hypothetical protein
LDCRLVLTQSQFNLRFKIFSEKFFYGSEAVLLLNMSDDEGGGGGVGDDYDYGGPE